MSVLQGLEPSQKFGVVVVGWWGSKGILEFRSGPNLGLGLEAWTKLYNMIHIIVDVVIIQVGQGYKSQVQGLDQSGTINDF